jgi:nucleotide-binding universal stress UspA family protein
MTLSIGGRVLMTVDGSDRSRNMVRYAAQILDPASVRVVLFHVENRVPDFFWDVEKNPYTRAAQLSATTWEEGRRAAMERFMEESRRILMDHGFPPASILTRLDAMKEGIARDILARTHDGYEAVFAGRRGQSRLRDLVLGGVATKLTNRLTDAPLVLVGGGLPRRKTLVALDGSEAAFAALRSFGALSARADHEVILFHAVRSFPYNDLAEESQRLMRESENVWVEDHLKHIRPQLEEARQWLIRAGFNEMKIQVRVVTGVVSRAGSVVEEARLQDCGAIVVGRRGLTAITENVMGRVSTKVIHLSRGLTVWLGS